MQLSHLVQNLPPYHFADAKKKIAERRAAGVDVITLSMGDPDLPAPPQVVERMCQEVHNPENHRYPEYRGMRALHEAISAWFARRYGVDLEPERDILPLLGSKEGLVYGAQAALNAGEIALVPDPYYTVYTTAASSLGAQPYLLPLREQNNYLPDLESIPRDVLAKTRLLWLNYPNNPTGASADMDFFERVVSFARRHNLVIIHDMAYGEVYFDADRPISILQIPGARDVAVELHSLSKTYNMAGFRLGMLLGNAQLVDAVGRLKSNVDSGIFRPLQYAAIEALHLPASWIEQRNAIYRHRRNLLVEGCRTLGMRAQTPHAGLYVWASVPATGDFQSSSRRFADWLFDTTGVLVTAGSNFGEAGEGYVRISITAPDERIETALHRMREAMLA